MHAIILVGGFGTRLNAIFPDLPKPMAPIAQKPFLAHLLDYLKQEGFCCITFSAHYLKETIQDYFQNCYAGMEIQYVCEAEPLGTGGAIKNALQTFPPGEPVFVLNGDTFLKLNYFAMYEQHKKNNANITLALRSVADCQRYGKVITEHEHIVAFKEKGEVSCGLINAGVYLLNPQLFAPYPLGEQFSFEKDFLLTYIHQLKPQYFITNDYFVDIGIPDDYTRANIELPVINAEP